MNTIEKLKAKTKELQNYVEENTNLDVEICSTSYPLLVSFYETQIDMFSATATNTAPKLRFVFNDEMCIITAKDFKINETVFNKLKNLSKEINRLYLHTFREEIDYAIEPIWNTVDGSQVALYRKQYFDKKMSNLGR